MTKKIRVNVTQRDIERGEKGSTRGCPVALALHRHKGLEDASVARSGVSVGDWWTSPPSCVQEFVERLDRFGPEAVAPFSFDLEVPE